MVPMGDWAEKRLKPHRSELRKWDRIWQECFKLVRPKNGVSDECFAVSNGNRKSKTQCCLSQTLPEWFIKLFTKENDWVLDPFAGSGTTCQVAKRC